MAWISARRAHASIKRSASSSSSRSSAGRRSGGSLHAAQACPAIAVKDAAIRGPSGPHSATRVEPIVEPAQRRVEAPFEARREGRARGRRCRRGLGRNAARRARQPSPSRRMAAEGPSDGPAPSGARAPSGEPARALRKRSSTALRIIRKLRDFGRREAVEGLAHDERAADRQVARDVALERHVFPQEIAHLGMGREQHRLAAPAGGAQGGDAALHVPREGLLRERIVDEQPPVVVTLAKAGERRAAGPELVVDGAVEVWDLERRRQAEAERPGLEPAGDDADAGPQVLLREDRPRIRDAEPGRAAARQIIGAAAGRERSAAAGEKAAEGGVGAGAAFLGVESPVREAAGENGDVLASERARRDRRRRRPAAKA